MGEVKEHNFFRSFIFILLEWSYYYNSLMKAREQVKHVAEYILLQLEKLFIHLISNTLLVWFSEGNQMSYEEFGFK